MITNIVQSKLVRQFSGVHRIWQILFVGVDEYRGISEFFVLEKSMKLIARLQYSFSIARVDDEYDAMCVLVIFESVLVARRKEDELQ